MSELVNILRTEAVTTSSLLKRVVLPNLTVARLLVALLMLLSLGLSLYNLHSVGDANAYYTAAIKAMLVSWHNFFFVAAEPGGAVSVDKPPLGLWIEALFGYLFGVSGIVLSIPNILVGVLDVPLLYITVKRYMGELAGVVAAVVFVLTPIAVATHRHNTFDGMLVFVLLLGTWAFVNATETQELRWLLLGGFFIGLGFNIKMLQALLPIPALYAFYFLASKEGWSRKVFRLILTTLLIAIISLAWPIAVDQTPSSQRPYVGSTVSNSMIELIFAYNGANRIFSYTTEQTISKDATQKPVKSLRPLPNFTGLNTSYEQQTGNPDIFRFFKPPLSRQMSWLLPFALISLVLVFSGNRLQIPVESPIHKSSILWGTWMFTNIVFFSAISGIFHPYYLLITLPGFCGVIASGYTYLWKKGSESKWIDWIMILSAVVTVSFQWITLEQFHDRTILVLLAGLWLVISILLMLEHRRFAYTWALLAIMLIPSYWTLMTAFTNADQTFPTVYQGGDQKIEPAFVANDPNLSANQRILSYLQLNTKDVKYLVAVPSALQGMPLILTSNRPVLYIGGFSGLDPIIQVDGLKSLVANGNLRYILYGEFFRRPAGAGRGDPAILSWLKTDCFVVPEFNQVIVFTRRPARPTNLADQGLNDPLNITGPRNDFLTLYLCP